MNEIECLGQLAGSLYIGGTWDRLGWTLAVILVAVPFPLAVYTVVAACRARMRTRERYGKRLPVRVPVLPVGYGPGVPADGKPLRPAEAQMFAGIVQRLRNDSRKRMVSRRHRPVRKTGIKARTGKR